MSVAAALGGCASPVALLSSDIRGDRAQVRIGGYESRAEVEPLAHAHCAAYARKARFVRREAGDWLYQCLKG